MEGAQTDVSMNDFPCPISTCSSFLRDRWSMKFDWSPRLTLTWRNVLDKISLKCPMFGFFLGRPFPWLQIERFMSPTFSRTLSIVFYESLVLFCSWVLALNDLGEGGSSAFSKFIRLRVFTKCGCGSVFFKCHYSGVEIAFLGSLHFMALSRFPKLWDLLFGDVGNGFFKLGFLTLYD